MIEEREIILINVINWNHQHVIFILTNLKLCLSSWHNLTILVNNFFLSILGIKIEKYIKMRIKPTPLIIAKTIGIMFVLSVLHNYH